MNKYADIKRLADLRTRSRLLLAQVAETMGTSKSHVSRFENGLDVVSPKYVERYARAIGVPAATVSRFYWTEVESHGWRLVKLAMSEKTRANRGRKSA